jgi:flagellar biogenesis protein FliO
VIGVRRLLAVLLLLSLPAPALAEGPAAPPEVAAPTSGAPATVAEPEIPASELPPGLVGAEDLDVGWALVRTIVVLGLVLALVYLTLNVGLRRLLGVKGATSAGLVTVLERVPLDQKRALFVIEAAGEVLLVGGAEGSLTLISKLDAAEVARLREAAGSPPVEVSPLLQKLLGRKQSPPSPGQMEKP